MISNIFSSLLYELNFFVSKNTIVSTISKLNFLLMFKIYETKQKLSIKDISG